jgi:hypothetical protein
MRQAQKHTGGVYGDIDLPGKPLELGRRGKHFAGDACCRKCFGAIRDCDTLYRVFDLCKRAAQISALKPLQHARDVSEVNT